MEVINKIQTAEDTFISVDSFDFSTLYTTLPHNLIKEKLSYLIKWTFDKTGHTYICCSGFNSFFSDDKRDKYVNWTYIDMINALTFLLDNIYVRFGSNVYR